MYYSRSFHQITILKEYFTSVLNLFFKHKYALHNRRILEYIGSILSLHPTFNYCAINYKESFVRL